MSFERMWMIFVIAYLIGMCLSYIDWKPKK
jgi:hypothetical protein